MTNVHAAKTNLSQLIEAALRGEDVVIARNGQPTVRLVPIAATSGPFQTLAGSVRVGVQPDPACWQADDELADLFEARDAR